MLRDPERLTALLLAPRAADPARHRRQGAPRRRRRQEAHPGARAVRRRPRGARPHRVPAQLRHRDGADLYPGCDVWLNNPLRPLEACGTSGMKAALNGGLNLSVLDGWWDEMYDGAQRLGDPDRRRRRRPGPPRRPRGGGALRPDREDGGAAVLRPRHRRHADRAGSRWCGTRCRPSARRCWPRRMVRDYVLGLYAPAYRSAGRWTAATPVRASWRPGRRRVRAAWPNVRVDHVEASGVGDAPEIGSLLEVQAFVSLGEPVARGRRRAGGARPGRRERPDHRLLGVSLRHDETYEGGRHRYVGDITLERPGPFGYTARVVPQHRLLPAPPSSASPPCRAERGGMDSGDLRWPGGQRSRRAARTWAVSAPARRPRASASGVRPAPGARSAVSSSTSYAVPQGGRAAAIPAPVRAGVEQHEQDGSAARRRRRRRLAGQVHPEHAQVVVEPALGGHLVRRRRRTTRGPWCRPGAGRPALEEARRGAAPGARGAGRAGRGSRRAGPACHGGVRPRTARTSRRRGSRRCCCRAGCDRSRRRPSASARRSTAAASPAGCASSGGAARGPPGRRSALDAAVPAAVVV